MRHPRTLQFLHSDSPLSLGSQVLAFNIFLSALLLALLLLATRSAPAQSGEQPHMARLSHVEGSVQILRGDKTEFEHAVPNMALVEGSRLQTGQDGRAEVQFDNGSIARLTPNSAMSLNQIQRGSAGAAATQVELLSGLGYFELRSRGGEDSLLFGSYTIAPVEGSATLRMNADAKPAELSVLDGTVHVIGGTAFAVDVHTEESLSLDATDPARYYLAQGVKTESWDQWNIDRDQALDQQALKRTEASQAQANSQDPGWSDLDQNGGWYAMQGYGNVWSPNGVGAGWDPYGSGYWGYYPGSGYMWISGYSWGWLPYRCGNWNYFNSFGWGWMPNNCGMGWNPGGGIYILNGPRGYRPPPRPHPSRAVASNGPGGVERVIRVDRGPQSRQILASGGTQSPKVFNGGVVHPLRPLSGIATPAGGGSGLRSSRPTQQTVAPSVQQAAPASALEPPRNGASSMRVPYNPPQHGETSATAPRGGAVGGGAVESRDMRPEPSPRSAPAAPGSVPSVPSRAPSSMPVPSPRNMVPAQAPRPSAPVQSSPPAAHSAGPPPQQYSAPAPHYSAPPPAQYSAPSAPQSHPSSSPSSTSAPSSNHR